MMIYPSYVVANLLVERRPIGTPGGAAPLLRLAAASAIVMTAWDLVVDPILSGPQVKAWIWEGGGPYFGIPVHNYAGWLLTTFTVYLAYRALEQRRVPRPGGARSSGAGLSGAATLPLGAAAAALPVAAYGLMLIADLLSGVAPAGLAIVGSVVMGVPFAAAALRLRSIARPVGREEPRTSVGRALAE
jgi:putative membrane protein